MHKVGQLVPALQKEPQERVPLQDHSTTSGAHQRGITIDVNGERVQDDLDVAATAGGANTAADLVYNDIRPVNGVITVRVVGSKVDGGERDAMLQALEVGPGDGGRGSITKSLAAASPSR